MQVSNNNTGCPTKNDTATLSHNPRINHHNPKFEAGIQCHPNLEHHAENRVWSAQIVPKTRASMQCNTLISHILINSVSMRPPGWNISWTCATHNLSYSKINFPKPASSHNALSKVNCPTQYIQWRKLSQACLHIHHVQFINCPIPLPPHTHWIR